MPPAATAELAAWVLAKGMVEMDRGLYPDTLLVHGMSELALIAAAAPWRAPQEICGERNQSPRQLH
jgi:hypothetical protein